MTRSILNVLILCFATVLIHGCGYDASPKDLDKEDARDRTEKNTDPDTDYCDLYDWYGDGQCDDFCANPDPDCGGGDRCMADPACPPDTMEVDFCETDSDDCTQISACGSTRYCRDLATCQGLPGCPDGYEQVDQCAAAAALDCVEVTECGVTIRCQEPLDTCDAYPVCPDGTEQVDQCDPDESTCQTASMCGTTIYCEQPEIDCLAAAACAEGYVAVDSCPTDTECYEETVCGTTISCLKEEPVDCQAEPVCPDGTMAVDDCPADAMCTEVEMCGKTLLCASI
jgi:hypothetical protein